MTQEEEILSQQREMARQTRNAADAMQKLVSLPEWSLYLRLIEAVAQNFNNTLNEPLENVMLVTKHEYAKGALKGLTLAATLPHIKIAEAKELNPGNEEA